MYKLILLAIKYILIEILSVKLKILYWKNFFNEISILKFLIKYQNSNISYFKDENLNNFLKYNKKTDQNNKKFSSKNKILVDLTVDHQPEHSLLNCLIANDLKKILKKNIVGLINSDDIKSKKIAQSFGIKNFIIHRRQNLFKRIFFFIKSLIITKNIDSIQKVLDFKYRNIDIGKCAYEHSIRFYCKSGFKIDFYFYLSVAKALENLDFFENLYLKNSFYHTVIGENQFIPHKIFFQRALKSKNIVYSRYGSGLDNYNVRIFKSFKDRYSAKRKFSKKLLNYLLKKHKKIIEKEIDNFFQKEKPEKKIGFEDALVGGRKKTTILNFKNKNEFNLFFNLKHKKKLNILILPNVLQDNILNSEWSLFFSPYDWFYKTILNIKDINNVNWIIKPHPSEKFYNEKFGVKTVLNKFIPYPKNIKLINHNNHINNIHKFIDLVITYNGSCGYEYSTLGIPVITVADGKYSDFNFTLNPKTQKQYFKYLKNFKEVKKTFKVKKNIAKLFWYMDICDTGIMRMTHGLIPKMKTQGNIRHVQWKEFWKKLYLNSKKTKNNENNYFNNFKLQQKALNRHTINFAILGKKKIKEVIKLNDA